MTNNHGGKRKGAGRKPSPFIVKLVAIAFANEAEYQQFLRQSQDTRQRAEILLQATKEMNNEKMVYYQKED